MKKNSARIIIFFLVNLTLICCQNTSIGKHQTTNEKDTTVQAILPIAIKDKILTAEEQKLLRPDAVIDNLKESNNRYLKNDLTARDHSALVRDAAGGQYPKAVILSCLDSRVPVEDIFDKGIGDLFVCRVAGNFVNEDILGSMEYGCKVSGAKLVVVMGHRYCGAIKAAVDNVQLGNITAMLSKIKPAVVMTQDFKGDKSSKNDAYVTQVAINNVKNTIKNIKLKSPILKEMLDKGEIKIVGAAYDLNTGEVTFLN